MLIDYPRYHAELCEKLGRLPSQAELARYCNVSPTSVCMARREGKGCHNLKFMGGREANKLIIDNDVLAALKRWESLNTAFLAEASGYAQRTVRKSLKRLHAKGLV